MLPAPAATRIFPTLFLRICPVMPEPIPRAGPTECSYLVLPQCLRPSQKGDWIGFPLCSTNTIFRGPVFEAAAISLCSSLPACLPSRSFLPLQILLQGSQGFYLRAERVSLPSHASDTLSARLQAIGGTRTCTSLDSQPCRLLLFPCHIGLPHNIPGSAVPQCSAQRLLNGQCFRACSHSIIFRPPSLLPPRSFPPLSTFRMPGRPWRYIRANRGLLPHRASDMLAV